jgi:hypothetical protein
VAGGNRQDNRQRGNAAQLLENTRAWRVTPSLAATASKPNIICIRGPLFPCPWREPFALSRISAAAARDDGDGDDEDSGELVEAGSQAEAGDHPQRRHDRNRDRGRSDDRYRARNASRAATAARATTRTT